MHSFSTQPLFRTHPSRHQVATGTGVPPATLAEFTLSGSGGLDYYDVSLVDGYNLPLQITPSVSSCHPAGCDVDLGPDCPANLKGPFDSTGFPVGCKSDCLVAPNPSNSPACCSGQYNTAAKVCRHFLVINRKGRFYIHSIVPSFWCPQLSLLQV